MLFRSTQVIDHLRKMWKTTLPLASKSVTSTDTSDKFCII